MGQITPDQLQALLRYASKQLGITPEQLASTVKNGGLESLAEHVGADNARRISSLMGDRQKAEQLLNSPDVQKMLGKLLGGQNKNG